MLIQPLPPPPPPPGGGGGGGGGARDTPLYLRRHNTLVKYFSRLSLRLKSKQVVCYKILVYKLTSRWIACYKHLFASWQVGELHAIDCLLTC